MTNPPTSQGTAELESAPAPIAVLRPLLPPATDVLPFLSRIDASRIYSNYGPLCQELQQGMARWLGAKAGTEGVRVVTASSGTTAIEIALRARALPGRRFCLMPSFTFIASAHAVCNAGLEPVLTDVEADRFTLTPALAEAALAQLPEPPAAVLVVSAFGAPPDVAAWEAFEAAHGIPVVFDAAAAVTSLRQIGHQPLAVSLHATKVFGIGEGGAVITTDGALADRLVANTGFGFASGERVSTERAGNYRISEYAAAVGLATLAGIDAKEQRLLRLGGLYAEALRNSPCRLQHGAGTEWATMTLNVVIPHERLDRTLRQLDAAGIQWRRWWGLGTHHHPAFADLRRTALPVTEDLAPRVIGLPFYEGLTEAEIGRVVEALR
ncbi:DegT/DnrJ/EryC1/StrS family aminotransferase [Sediminicoccus rosea]|uniref:DegT/DnrJ/EryC1/StrS family aminotransferase n=1 Tax=Sediminicoccus rosea TaxID=1225128 RepID=A0ABZ0PCD1_9PROT|nr:DegT/DnrJ/EryC1/StrS family aminotransferase [Sediminicoccus rosea]WPB83355.1 DegT/DnrJ/EryC1/StrS family aminotransferase [Sediminicoccus rosea]